MNIKILLILVFYFNLVHVQAQCIEGICSTGTGTYVYPSGAKYVGQFKDNKINGLGTLYFNNGNVYIGQWVNNYREGEGKLKFKNGDLYSGGFKQSKQHGQGSIVFALGGHYTGEWKNDLPHGKGIYLYANGERYEGLIYEGQRHGYGKYYYSDKSYYDGQWKENSREGDGLLVLADGTRTQGQWHHDEIIHSTIAQQTSAPNEFKEEASSSASSPVTSPPTNKPNESKLADCNQQYCDGINGIYVYKDGSKYIGPFKKGNPYGQGILYYANGDRYEGGWDDVAPDGQGIMHFASGRVYAAIWDRGRPVKQLDQRTEIPKRRDIKIVHDEEVRIWPVIIGVARYAHMPALKYADDDAYKMYAFLKSPEGGAIPDQQIKLLIDEDATRSNILDALQQQYGQADENDLVILYYSGHGIAGSLLPIDFDGFNNKLYHDEITKLMDESKAKHKLSLIDACYAGSASDPKADFSTEINKFYNKLDSEKGGSAMILSCKSREVSLEDSGLRQGIFSHYLIKGLKGEADVNSNKIITVQELFNFIHKQVTTYTSYAQNPMIEGQYNTVMPVAWVR